MLQEVGEFVKQAVEQPEGYLAPRLVGAAHQVEVAADDAPLLRAKCCTASNDESPLNDVDGG